jgi:hypothetical protein
MLLETFDLERVKESLVDHGNQHAEPAQQAAIEWWTNDALVMPGMTTMRSSQPKSSPMLSSGHKLSAGAGSASEPSNKRTWRGP